MSDFLQGFSQDKYKKTPAKTEQEQAQDKNVMGAPGQTPLSKDENGAPKSTGLPDNARDELFEKDPDLEKKRKRRLILIIAGILVGCLVIALPYYFSRRVKVPDFVKSTPEQVQAWALRNNIFVEIEEEFNLEYNRNLVIAQTPAAGAILFKGGSIEIVVSKGPDPDERLELPNFSAMTIYEIEQWINEHRANNINITRAYDDTIPVNHFIKIEFRDPAVTAENYRRKDRATITISMGPEKFAKDIEVKDFKEKPIAEAESWAESAGIKLQIEEAYSDSVPEGMVISQSIAPGTMIAKNEEMTITVSKGKAIYAPNFAGLSEVEADALAATAGVQVQKVYYYHAKVKAGALISQSINPGTLLEEGRNTIILYYSLGKPYIPDFSLENKTEADVELFFADLNSKKANLKLKRVYIYDGKTPKGTVIMNSHAGEIVDLDEIVTVTFSKGGRVVIKNYVGQLLENVIDELENLKAEQGLKYAIEYDEADKYKNAEDGEIVEQSKTGPMDTAEHVLILKVAVKEKKDDGAD
ncbi:MAG: PASTA domain-containing protein [Firmicutes bacterium]|jgi:serine/threonine-protein kinase|nr:PASTA domain-containing protein [Bacillota bacterium]